MLSKVPVWRFLDALFDTTLAEVMWKLCLQPQVLCILRLVGHKLDQFSVQGHRDFRTLAKKWETVRSTKDQAFHTAQFLVMFETDFYLNPWWTILQPTKSQILSVQCVWGASKRYNLGCPPSSALPHSWKDQVTHIVAGHNNHGKDLAAGCWMMLDDTFP